MERLETGSVLDEIRQRCAENKTVTAPAVEDSDAIIARANHTVAVRKARAASIVWGRFADASIGSYRKQSGTAAGYDAAKDVVAGGFTQPLALFGRDTGLGKTYLLAAMANEAIALGKRVVVANPLEIVTLVSDARRSWDASEADTISHFAAADFLGLDDLGKELFNGGDAALRVMYQIIDARFNSGRHLWLTSNFSMVELAERYHARKDEFAVYFIDRIKAMIPPDRWIAMSGRSLRGRV